MVIIHVPSIVLPGNARVYLAGEVTLINCSSPIDVVIDVGASNVKKNHEVNTHIECFSV